MALELSCVGRTREAVAPSFCRRFEKSSEQVAKEKNMSTDTQKQTSQLVLTTRLVRTTLPDLTGTEKAVLIYLSSLIGLDNNHPCETTIAACTGFCLKTIKAVIKSLAVKGYIEVKSTKTKTGRRNYYEVKPEKWMGGQPKNGPMGQGKNGLMGQGKNGPIIDTLQSNGIERPKETTSQQASKQPDPTPTAEPTEPLANCAQQSLRSLADEPTALAQSATPTKPPFKYCREIGNKNTFEGPAFQDSMEAFPPPNQLKAAAAC